MNHSFIEDLITPNELAAPLTRVTSHVYRCDDTCAVYLIQSGEDAICIDFGSGRVLDWIEPLGIRQITDVLLTHHHRDGTQGLSLAAEHGARIWAPHAERDLIQTVDQHWAGRSLLNHYNPRQDRFSLLEPVSLSGTLLDYSSPFFAGSAFHVLPTPGHTPGSISLIAELDGLRMAFSGDLIAAPGKVWSLAATQWSYNGGEGLAASVPSLLGLREMQPELILPAHGEVMSHPADAIDLLVSRLVDLMARRWQNPRLNEWIETPYIRLLPHLLLNRTSTSNSYVLLSESGKALIIDYGYDLMTGFAAGSDTASRRPLLSSLPKLKEQFGVTKVDVVIPTHTHDDHVAGLNLLHRVEGTQIWAAENFADVLLNPSQFDLPCLWYDPIPVDRSLPLNKTFLWEEYSLVLYPLPGHSEYAVAIGFKVDGKRVLAVGDQFMGEGGHEWNYVYQNRFQAGDYRTSVSVYRDFWPDLILPGHWHPFWMTPTYLEEIEAKGVVLEEIHQDLLLDGSSDLAQARIMPYQSILFPGEALDCLVEVRNPCETDESVKIRLVTPAGWQVTPPEAGGCLASGQTRTFTFRVLPVCQAVLRARIAADLSIGNHAYGQIAEALVSVVNDTRSKPCYR